MPPKGYWLSPEYHQVTNRIEPHRPCFSCWSFPILLRHLPGSQLQEEESPREIRFTYMPGRVSCQPGFCTFFLPGIPVATFCFVFVCFPPPFRRRQWHPTPVLLPGKSHGRRGLEGCSPWGCQESDTTERLHFHFSLSCIGEGNGNPLQCSCLENPRDRGAWWAAVYGVSQSRTWLKRLSSSSSIRKRD